MFLYFAYLIIFILVCLSIKKKSAVGDFLEIETTKNFSGLFVLFVFLAHFSQYSFPPKYIQILQKAIGQLIVVPFLFVSGYGVTLSFLNKPNYKKTFFAKRIFPLYFQFAVAVFLYCILDFAITREISSEKIKTYLLSFTGFRNVGNSNWYVVAIIFCYLTSFLGFIKKSKFSIWTSFFLICAYVIAMYILSFEFHWFNTVLAYFAGELCAYNKDKILKRLSKFNGDGKKMGGGYVCVVLLEIVLFGGLFIMYWLLKNDLLRSIFYNLVSAAFCLLFATLTFKFDFKQPVFSFLGKHIFSIYILQRIPMILFSKFINNSFLLFILCLCSTLLLAVIFDFGVKKVLKK